VRADHATTRSTGTEAPPVLRGISLARVPPSLSFHALCGVRRPGLDLVVTEFAIGRADRVGNVRMVVVVKRRQLLDSAA
jgi:hypothetical protein